MIKVTARIAEGRAVKIYLTRISGVGELLGSIEVGKMASLIVTDGDPLEFKTKGGRWNVKCEMRNAKCGIN